VLLLLQVGAIPATEIPLPSENSAEEMQGEYMQHKPKTELE
jgi:hypothetical protein